MKPLTREFVLSLDDDVQWRVPVDRDDLLALIDRCNGAELREKTQHEISGAMRERADSAEAAVEYQRSAITAAVAGENAALAQVAALREALMKMRDYIHGNELLRIAEEWLEAALADTTKAATEHDARVGEERLAQHIATLEASGVQILTVAQVAAVRREARAKALRSVEELAQRHENEAFIADLRALAASEPEGE